MSNMVVVISDLHFEEEKSDMIEGPDHRPVGLRRNVPAAFFESMIRDMVDLARRRAVEKIEFVLAGDVFDLHRTQLWFGDGFAGVRPFVDNGRVGEGSELEARVLEILDRIAGEDEVQRSLEAFQRLAQGCMLDGDEMREIGIPVTMHFLPGNHDRLVNATPALRRRTRRLLGLGDDASPFPHNLLFQEPNVFVRHGHEYDPSNFGGKLRRGLIERNIDEALYDKATFGDFVTVQVATRMPNIFRSLYGDQVGTDPLLRTVYLRLLEFDDLRPQKAIVRFILDIRPPAELRAQFRGRPDKWQEEMWRKVEPAVRRLLDDVRETACGHPDARAVVPRWIRAALWLRPWRWGIPLGLVRLFGWCMGLFDSDSRPYLKAQRERVLVGEGGADFVAAGHTHAPQVAHLYMDRQERKKYFVDTGTWRNAVLGAARRRQFGRVNATTFVAFFGPREPRTRAFEFRTGLGQEWPVDDSDQ